MNKVNLLEKLRTLQQWQIQQQQDFSSHSKIILNQQDVSSTTNRIESNQQIKNNISKYESVNSKKTFFKNEPFDNRSDLSKNDLAASEYFLSDLNSTSTPSKNILSFPVSSKNFGSDSEDGLSDFNANDVDFKVDGVEPINDDYYNSPYDANKVTVEQAKNSDEIPIKATFKDHENLFEELLDRELKRAPFVKPRTVKSKFTFLKRGEGLKRFQKENSLNRNKKIINKNKNDLSNKIINNVGLPLKLKLKAKEDLKSKEDSKPKEDPKIEYFFRDVQDKNLLSVNNHNLFKDNTTISVSKLKKTCFQNAPFVNVVSDTEIFDTEFSDSKIYDNNSELHNDDNYSEPHNDDTDSEPHNDLDKISKKELLAFEELEEAAENLSLSSNCSVVQRLLGKRNFKKGEFSFINMEEVSSNSVHHKFEKHPSLQHSHGRQPSLHISQEMHPPFEFFDEESWSDASKISENLNETLINETVVDVSFKEIKPKRFVCKRKETRNNIENNIEERFLFKVEKESKETRNEEIDQLKQTTDNVAEIQPHFPNISDVVKLKLETLEKEITKFRMENEKLSKLRQERETDLNALRKQLKDFEKEKLEEIGQFEQYKLNEIKKLKAEKKSFENYQKTNKDIPNKIEREEIKELSDQISRLKDEIKFKEERWNAATIRFRSKVLQLEEENASLQKQVIMLEQERLQRIKKNGRKDKVVTFAKNSVTDTEQQEFSGKHGENKYEIEASVKETERDCCENDQIIAISAMSTSSISNHQLIKGKQIKHNDGKVESMMADGSRVIKFANGTEKIVSADERTISIKFFNGDVKRVLPDNRMVYYYAESQTTHTTFTDGLEVLQFPNNQVEKRFPSGQIEITFPDQTVKKIMTNGCEETLFADGTVQRTEIDGQTVIVFPNGQREIHALNYKKREYPNGTVKTIYDDGRQETKYSNGRLRVKDKQGNLLIDTGETE